MTEWELIRWADGDGENLSISLSKTQIEVLFKTLGIKIIDNGNSYQIQHYTDNFLKTRLKSE